jgi:hypothetical protein
MNIDGPRPIPNRIQIALDLALEEIVSKSRISLTRHPIGMARRDIA